MSNWAVGWVYVRGLRIRFDDRFLDVAVKLKNFLGGELLKEGEAFVLSVSEYPEIAEVDLSFLRGVFEAGGIWGSRSLFVPKVERFNREIRKLLTEYSFEETGDGFFLLGEGANLFIHALYDEETEERSEFLFEKFLRVITGSEWERTFFSFSLEKGALPPFKKRISDSGWDLHLISLIKKDG
ncbi:MAG: dUTP pyrophosphatase, partial [Desulfurobacteriaceae bacterium]